jgi:hypothetical protein
VAAAFTIDAVVELLTLAEEVAGRFARSSSAWITSTD